MEEPKLIIEMPKTVTDCRWLIGLWLVCLVTAVINLLGCLAGLSEIGPIGFVVMASPSIAVVGAHYLLRTVFRVFYTRLWKKAFTGE